MNKAKFIFFTKSQKAKGETGLICAGDVWQSKCGELFKIHGFTIKNLIIIEDEQGNIKPIPYAWNHRIWGALVGREFVENDR